MQSKTPNATKHQRNRTRAAMWRAVQNALAQLGYNPGPVDGLMGPSTRRAIAAFQRANGYESTGRLTSSQRAELVTGKRSSPAAGIATVITPLIIDRATQSSETGGSSSASAPASLQSLGDAARAAGTTTTREAPTLNAAQQTPSASNNDQGSEAAMTSNLRQLKDNLQSEADTASATQNPAGPKRSDTYSTARVDPDRLCHA